MKYITDKSRVYISQYLSQSVSQVTMLIVLTEMLVLFLSVEANILENGDFDSGSLAPWHCNGCHCQTKQKYLAVTERRANWAGPRQSLNPGSFSAENLQYQLNFSLQALQPLTASWKLKVVAGEEEKYFMLLQQAVSSSDWTHWSAGINIDNIVLRADFIELYMEATPDTADYNLDDVVLQEFGSGKYIACFSKHSITISSTMSMYIVHLYYFALLARQLLGGGRQRQDRGDT